jgi:glutathione-independent formaldehyde dehydrogenase
MNAVVYRGPREVAVQSVPDPVSQAPTDAIVRLTTTALCGSDLHTYDGRTGAKAGDVIGHEPLGIVEWVARESHR